MSTSIHCGAFTCDKLISLIKSPWHVHCWFWVGYLVPPAAMGQGQNPRVRTTWVFHRVAWPPHVGLQPGNLDQNHVTFGPVGIMCWHIDDTLILLRESMTHIDINYIVGDTGDSWWHTLTLVTQLMTHWHQWHRILHILTLATTVDGILILITWLMVHIDTGNIFDDTCWH